MIVILHDNDSIDMSLERIMITKYPIKHKKEIFLVKLPNARVKIIKS